MAEEPFLPADRAEENRRLLSVGRHEQDGNAHTRRSRIRNPIPVVAIDPQAEGVEIRGNFLLHRRSHGDRLCALPVRTIRQFQDIVAEKLLLTGPLGRRDGSIAFRLPNCLRFKIFELRMVVFHAVRPVHFVWPLADGLRADARAGQQHERQWHHVSHKHLLLLLL